MMKGRIDNNMQFMSPSELYRQRRPEYFSDSENIADVVLAKEVLVLEIEKISTNQKQDLFENLCRKLAEKLICPNLIPQVGPTGGGDGKTDSETYPVSELISERWFVPIDGWKRDENWAFAFSAKEDWKAKIKSDIEKVVNTNRGYTKFFFMSNQKISSKKKKDTQNMLNKKYGIGVTILDAVWIIESIYENHFIGLAAEALNMSDVYRTYKKHLGKNDYARQSELEDIEEKIKDTQYYPPGDIQIIHAMVQAAVLSRMLELPRDEVEAKFTRAEQLCKKYNAEYLLTKVIYQKAWTYMNYYNDYSSFIEEAVKLKELVNEKSENIELEWLFNVFNLYYAINRNKLDNIPNRDNVYSDFENHVINILSLRSQNQEKPCSALIARTNLTFVDLMHLLHSSREPSDPLKSLSEIILSSQKYLEYPFESIYQSIIEIGSVLVDNNEYDTLIEHLAKVSSLRESEINSGIIYFNRGLQKFEANRFKESIVYFGRAAFKLAKEETSKYLVFALTKLAESYKELALPWASYNCLITAVSLESKKFSEEKIVTKPFLYLTKLMLSTEILLGRLPNIFFWYRLFSTLYQQYGDKKDGIPDDIMLDGCLAVRLLHIEQKENNLTYLPYILERLNLQTSRDAVLFLLGYEDEIIEYYNVKNSLELESFFQKVYSQPLNDQSFFQTAFQNFEMLTLKSIIIGCEIVFKFDKDKNMNFIVETILSLIESMLATSVGKIFPIAENIIINVVEDNNVDYFLLSKDNETDKLILKVNVNSIFTDDNDSKTKSFFTFLSFILANYFSIENIHEYLDNIFGKESLNERLFFTFRHKLFSTNVMGNNPEIFFEDWKDDESTRENKRLSPIIFHENRDKASQSSKLNKEIEDMPHNKVEVHSIIDEELWKKAKWNATGVIASPDDGILGLALIFDDFEVGKKIFSDWTKITGGIDKDELIDITIIKGINKHNPYWYRVIVTANRENKDDKYYIITSRVQEMQPEDNKNLTNFENIFLLLKKYILYPSSMKALLPEHLQYGIVKTKITIKYAWQVSLNDPSQVAIRDTDEPVLPEGIDNIPILSIFEQRKNMTNNGKSKEWEKFNL